MDSCLVTGGAGFIGQALVRRLLDHGIRVRVVDRADEGRQAAALARLRRHPRAETHLRVNRMDLAEGAVHALLGDVDAVVHLAGRPGVQTSWGHGFDGHVRDNVVATQRLLEACLEVGVGRVVVASSSSVHPGAPDGPVREDVPLRPTSPYGVAKAAAEQLAGVYAARGLDTVALRFFTVYGRHQRPDMAMARMTAALAGGPAFPLRGDGRQERDWTHVDDVVAGVVAALHAGVAPGTVANVGSGRPVALREVATLVGELAGRPVPLQRVAAVPGDPARTWADLATAERLLGYRPRVALADGLRDQLLAAGALRPTSRARAA